MRIKPGQEGHHLEHALHLGAFEGQAAGHDHADVARAEDDEALAGHVAFHVDPALGGAGGVDAGRARAGEADLGAGALAAAHRQHDGAGFDVQHAVGFAGGVDAPARADIQHHRVQQGFNAQREGFVDEELGIGRAGQVFLEHFQPEAVVDALQQDAAQLEIALDDQNVLGAVLFGGDGGCQPARTAADDDHVVFVFARHLPSICLYIALCLLRGARATS